MYKLEIGRLKIKDQKNNDKTLTIELLEQESKDLFCLLQINYKYIDNATKILIKNIGNIKINFSQQEIREFFKFNFTLWNDINLSKKTIEIFLNENIDDFDIDDKNILIN